MTKRVFVYTPENKAYAEDGQELEASPRAYRTKYPEGFELIRVTDMEQLKQHIISGELRGLNFEPRTDDDYEQNGDTVYDDKPYQD